MISTLILMAGPFLMGYLMGSIPFGLLLTRAAGLGDIPQRRFRQHRRHQRAAHRPQRTCGGHPAAGCAEGRGCRADRRPGGATARRRRRRGRRAGPHVPVLAGFKGGKCRPTTLGRHVGPVLAVGAIACAAWLLLAAAFRYSSLAALLSVVVAAIAAWFMTDARAAMLLTLLVPLVWVRHHENIARLLNGTEPKIGQGKKQAA